MTILLQVQSAPVGLAGFWEFSDTHPDCPRAFILIRDI